MKIKRYEIVADDTLLNYYTIIDRLKDSYVRITLVCKSEQEAKEIMGEDMDEVVDSDLVHPNYIKRAIQAKEISNASENSEHEESGEGNSH